MLTFSPQSALRASARLAIKTAPTHPRLLTLAVVLLGWRLKLLLLTLVVVLAHNNKMGHEEWSFWG